MSVGVPTTGLAAIGRTPGGFAVSPTGAATYSIPVFAVPGAHGYKPNLALTYSSQVGDGPFGVGWSLSGLSSITRCTLTSAQDAAPAPITLTYADRFCLDGNRLRLTSSTDLGTYGQNGTTYQTEVANFNNVTAHNSAGQGPSYFTVQGKDGLTYTYGSTSTSQVLLNGTVSSWLLDTVQDRYGNTLMTVTYTTATGTAVPSSVRWGPSGAGQTTRYSILFDYTTVPRVHSVGYVAGANIQDNNVASDITVFGPSGTVTTKYLLGYTTSQTSGRQTLTSMQQCADSQGTNCLQATSFAYQPGGTGVSATPVTTPSAVLYDFNGDGLPDAFYASGTSYVIALNTGSGFSATINTGISTSNSSVVVGDLLGTGADGILAVNGGTFYYYTYQSSTNTFSSGVSTGVAYTNGYTYTLADITGDGLADLIAIDLLQVTTIANTSQGGSISFAPAFSYTLGLTNTNIYRTFLNAGDKGSAQALRSFDFNGDGRKDLMLTVLTRVNSGGGEVSIYYHFHQLISQGASGQFQLVSMPFNPDANLPVPVFGNFNDDRCTDVALESVVYYSGCNGAFATTVTLTGALPIIGAMDWDADGRTDILAGAGGSALSVYHSTGTGFLASQATSFTIPSGCTDTWFAGDVDGDGLDDFGCWNSTANPAFYAYYPHNQAGQPPDLLSNVKDGYSNSVTPAYVPISRGSYTKCNGSNCPLATSPEQEFQDSTYVVSQLVASDGTGGTYTQSYSYAGARRNLQGYGFEGFKIVTASDTRPRSLVHRTTYDTAFPLTGMVSQDDIFQNDGTTPVSHSSFSNADRILDSTANNQQHLPLPTSANTSNYEVQIDPNGVAGPKNGQLISSVSTTYTFDDYGNSTNVATTMTDNDAGSPYNGQIWTTSVSTTIPLPSNALSSWCLTQPTQISVTKSGTGVPGPITRTTGFGTPDYMHCNATQRITEPSSAYQLSETYGYDAFGNVSSVSLTGANVGQCPANAPCIARIDWGVTGQFPMTTTNALNQATTYDYNFDFGLPISVSDPNHITATSHYDVFGRKDRENRPDGTATTWSYTDCSANNNCPGTSKMLITATDLDANGTYIRDTQIYPDQLDRPIQQLTRSFNDGGGAYVFTDSQYDAFGRVIRAGIPCLTGACNTSVDSVRSSYDPLGRVIQIQRPTSGSDSSPETGTVSYAGRTTTTTDPQGKQTTTVTTVAGTPARSQDHNGYSQTFTADAFGTITNIQDSAGNSLYTAKIAYGAQAFTTDVTDMDMDVSVTPGQHRQYTFDALGELISWSDAKGQTFSMTYDALSRPLTRTETLVGGTTDLTTTWKWDTAPGNCAATPAMAGQLMSVSANSYAECYQYDSLGRVTNRTIGIPGDGTYSYDFSYNATTGFLDTLTYPTSTSYRLKLQYGYNHGYLQNISDFNAPATVFWAANSTDALGHVTQETLGNSVLTHRSFDPVNGSLASVQSGLNGGATLQNESYLWDHVGNLTQRQNNNTGLTENFYYDNLYRLYYSTLNGVNNLQMCYDNAGGACTKDLPGPGNITSRSDIAGGAAWTYDTTRTHRVLTAGDSNHTYTYDLNGNATSRGAYAISWTSFNHPSVINVNGTGDGQKVEFSYNQNHERWLTKYTSASGVETTYDIGGLMEKVVGVGGVFDYRHFIYAGSTKVATYSRTTSGTNTLRYIREDHLGGVSAILNADGTSYVKESFTAFGDRRNSCTWSGPPTSGQQSRIAAATRHGYTWQTALGSMGLNDMNGRIEDAVTGRFLSADPTIPDAGNTQSYNRYTYVNNNPLTFSDPSGFTPCNGRVDSSCKDVLQAINQGNQEKARYLNELNAWLTQIWEAYNQPDDGSPVGIGTDGQIYGAPFERELARGVASGTVPVAAASVAFGYDTSIPGTGPGGVPAGGRTLQTQAPDGDITVEGHRDGRPGTVYWPSSLVDSAPNAPPGFWYGLATFGGLVFNGASSTITEFRNDAVGVGASEIIAAGVGAVIAARGAAPLADEAFHYTFSRYVSSIETNGLRAGSYATDAGELSPLQAQIDLALPANRGLPDALLRIDLNGLRSAGYDVPEFTRAGRMFNMPGGGMEIQFPYSIPPEFISVIR